MAYDNRPQQAPAKANALATMLRSDAVRKQFAEALGKTVPVERFVRVCVTAVRQVPKLAQCDQASFMASLMTCAQLGLEPNTPQGLAYLVPFKNRAKGIMECQVQIGYRGLLSLMWQSGQVASINADVVYRQEVERGLFRYCSGMEATITHNIDLLDDCRSGGDEDIVAAYACAKLVSGQTVLRVITRRELDEARRASQGGDSQYSPWATHFKAMAMKTAIKRLSRWVPTTRANDAIALEDERERSSMMNGAAIGADPRGASFAQGADALNAALDDAPAPEPAQRRTRRTAAKRSGTPIVDHDTGEVLEAAPAAPAPAPAPESEPAPAPASSPANTSEPSYVYELEDLLFEDGVSAEDVIAECRRFPGIGDSISDAEIAESLCVNTDSRETVVASLKERMAKSGGKAATAQE